LRSAGGEILDDALVLRFDGPASVTGEHLVELHCHGSRAVVAAILRELATSPGLREALPGEFTRRSFENGRIDLTQAEGLADLLEAETEGQRRAALQVTGGAIRRQVELWRDELLVLSAKAEAAIDYADEEDETQTQAADLAQAASQLRSDIASWLARPRAEPLRHGVRVVIAGPPNAGKSSLLNSLVGIDRAIVSQEPGTTRT
jgi:tRNA modification GTPase